MKKIVFLILLGFGIYDGFSQSTLYVLSKTPVFNNMPSNDCPIGDYTYDYDISHTTGTYDVISNEIEISISFQEGYNDDPGNDCNGPCGAFGWYCDYTYSEDLHPFDTMEIEYDGPEEIICTASEITCMPIDYYAALIPKLNVPDDVDRCPEQSLFEQYQDNQNHTVEGLKWQYFNKFDQWVDLPNYSNRYPLNVSVEEALGSNFETLFEGNLQLRFLFTAPFMETTLNSSVVTFSIISCSPQLIDITSKTTSCPNSNDGSFTLILDRDLEEEEEEKLVVSVYNVNNDTEIIAQDYTSSLVDNGNNTFSFVWVKPLAQGNYKVKYQTHPTNNVENDSWNSLEFSPPFQIEGPEPVNFSLSSSNINCHAGNDGTISIEANGGTGNNYQYRINESPWVNFSNGNSGEHTIEDLAPGEYTIEVRDGNHCTGTPNGENELTLVEPSEPVSIMLDQFQEPAGFGFTNGSITAMINGGTPLNDSYNYQWKDENDNILNTTAAEVTNSGYQVTLNSIGAGVYTLIAWDNNYAWATTKAGCEDIWGFELSQPPPLQVSMQESMSVSCNSANTFDNPSNDAELTATASGGVPFDPLIDGFYAYSYTWKKKNDQNVWEVIPDVSGNVLGNVGAGEYAVNIEDANGIIVGTYVNNILQQANDYTFLLNEPQLLTVDMEKTDVNCFGGKDGTATATISGGTPPYEVLWSTGTDTEMVNDLAAGTYFVYVMDALGCEVSGQVIIEQLGSLDVKIVELENPTCHDAGDGSITVEIIGGVEPYTYSWDSGLEATSISGIPQGTYTFQVMDANGCEKSVEIQLEAPIPLDLGLEEEKVLCVGQVYEVDISIEDPDATYQWTSNKGFNGISPKVALSEEGIYTATVTTSLGCTSSDTIEIIVSDTQIDSEFLITSQAFAGEEIVLVNTSNPLGTTEEWIFPEQAHVVEKSTGLVVLRFDEPGAYEVALRNYQRACYEDFTKNIIVEQARQLPDVGDAPAPFIKEYIVSPNPSTGSFTVKLSLREEAKVSLRLYGFTSNVPYDDRQFQNDQEYEIPYVIDLPAGIYFLLLETPKESQIRKIIVL
ncbi:T9SS type A sorting domain-containing protein [Flagellimonas onchidii]|uniref:T9SS type A sorting domain-containing protein n=1 Tax=Flagellimonas onchidii TaxID=2562684 RepID=UPI0010A5B1B4|nr:T9SS type A sorting domain-containing protein [Allomuricauda onchidii]